MARQRDLRISLIHLLPGFFALSLHPQHVSGKWTLYIFIHEYDQCCTGTLEHAVQAKWMRITIIKNKLLPVPGTRYLVLYYQVRVHLPVWQLQSRQVLVVFLVRLLYL